MQTVIDINNFYSEVERQDVLLSYKGAITKELLSALFPIVESQLEKEIYDSLRRKKIFHIVVECFQNVFHHMESFKNLTAHEKINGLFDGLFIIMRGADKSFIIFTGNFILNEKLITLRERIENVNAMSSQQLKEYYRASLSTSELSEKGGAGLGIIDMARKSGNKLAYQFKQINESYSFFSLEVRIN